MRCPFCLRSVRGLGGIILLTPEQIHRESGQPIMGECCVDCLGLIAITLDGLRNGRINSLEERYTLNGAIKRN